MKSKLKKFLLKKGVNVVVVNKHKLKLSQAKTSELIKVAFEHGYGDTL